MARRLIATLLLLTAFPVMAVQAADHGGHEGHDHHGAAGTSKAVPHTHATATADDVKATFHFNPAKDAKSTCPMHPEVVSDKPGKCPTCKMGLAKQTHSIGVGLESLKTKQPIMDAKVHLQITDAHGMAQELALPGQGHWIGQVHLVPGKHMIKAAVTPKGGKSAMVTVPYEVK